MWQLLIEVVLIFMKGVRTHTYETHTSINVFFFLAVVTIKSIFTILDEPSTSIKIDI